MWRGRERTNNRDNGHNDMSQKEQQQEKDTEEEEALQTENGSQVSKDEGNREGKNGGSSSDNAGKGLQNQRKPTVTSRMDSKKTRPKGSKKNAANTEQQGAMEKFMRTIQTRSTRR